jgi:hypothetical protein
LAASLVVTFTDAGAAEVDWASEVFAGGADHVELVVACVAADAAFCETGVMLTVILHKLHRARFAGLSSSTARGERP